ncbi:type VI immunity family protein [Hyalangium rubrum]|uniref:DUF3396 domain-containing protein n=1 Tax=Hyalangium rubrum TaxID=3103134 RepID=A0ABU5H4J3_9BACT|nr:type VI immunity family protein [Hyalangium sp. s54d21]MDY7227804.1 DUF3396 domain-containing protein [Hyalangium sp. s54d21]
MREGLSFNFYMRRPHVELAQGVLRSLESYLDSVGPQALGWYATDEGEYRPLDAAGWQLTRDKVLRRRGALIRLRDASLTDCGYRFLYHGRPLVDLSGEPSPDVVCVARFWLPTEFLEEHGAARVRALALALAAPLPFCSGHAGLSFNGDLDLPGVKREVHQQSLRYPGMDLPEEGSIGLRLGTRLWGVHWLTFLGQPVLGALGGAAGLRARLHEPGTTVQELSEDRAVVTLGPGPEAGDTEQGQTLPAFRELARVLEPWLYHEEKIFDPDLLPDEKLRWERRFLD